MGVSKAASGSGFAGGSGSPTGAARLSGADHLERVPVLLVHRSCSWRSRSCLASLGTGSAPTLILAAFAPGDVPAIRLATRAPKGGGMLKVVITHAVKDVETWLEGKAERAGSHDLADA